MTTDTHAARFTWKTGDLEFDAPDVGKKFNPLEPRDAHGRWTRGLISGWLTTPRTRESPRGTLILDRHGTTIGRVTPHEDGGYTINHFPSGMETHRTPMGNGREATKEDAIATVRHIHNLHRLQVAFQGTDDPLAQQAGHAARSFDHSVTMHMRMAKKVLTGGQGEQGRQLAGMYLANAAGAAEHILSPEDAASFHAHASLLHRDLTGKELPDTRTIDTPMPSREALRSALALTPGQDAAAARLERDLAAGLSEEKKPGEGLMADTALVKMNNGSRWVRKRVDPDNKNDNHAELLASRVGEIVGAGAPPVLTRPGTRDTSEIWMGFVNGPNGMRWAQDLEDQGTPPGELKQAILNSPEGRRIGKLDALIGNVDRNDGNWMLEDGKPHPIDHGYAYFPVLPAPVSPFTVALHRWLTTEASDGEKAAFRQELADDTAKLMAMEPEFAALGHTTPWDNWHQNMMVNMGIMSGWAQ